jgi:DNA-binding NarL/FixJ family response regulator
VLLKAIDKVHNGELWFERAIMARHIDQEDTPQRPDVDSDAARIASLTSREREIIGLIGQGMRNARIAATLFISEKTVRNHVSAIYAKLSVTDRFELALYSYKHALARLPL